LHNIQIYKQSKLSKSAVLSTEAQRNGEIFEQSHQANFKDFSTAVEMTTNLIQLIKINS